MARREDEAESVAISATGYASSAGPAPRSALKPPHQTGLHSCNMISRHRAIPGLSGYLTGTRLGATTRHWYGPDTMKPPRLAKGLGGGLYGFLRPRQSSRHSLPSVRVAGRRFSDLGSALDPHVSRRQPRVAFGSGILCPVSENGQCVGGAQGLSQGFVPETAARITALR